MPALLSVRTVPAVLAGLLAGGLSITPQQRFVLFASSFWEPLGQVMLGPDDLRDVFQP